jgi:hypothetical protein
MTVKRILCPERLRRIPSQFSWLDHRLVREGHIGRCGPEALALYLLLVCVGDAEGLSYYSDRKTAELTGLEEGVLRRARRELIEAGLIAYEKPLYQVLSLERPPEPPRPAAPRPKREERCVSIGEVLRSLRKEAS